MSACDCLERWAPVPGYESSHSVSSKGRFRRDISGHSTWPGRMLNPVLNKGYFKIHFVQREQMTPVHRLVALAFIGSPPTSKHEINHIDGVKTNNCACNLEWVTRGENVRHAFRIGLNRARGARNPLTGSGHPGAKLNETQVLEIRDRLRNGESGNSIAKLFGVCLQTIYSIKDGHTWTCLPGESR